MLGRLIGIKLMRKAERSQRIFKPNINDSTIKRAYDAGFVDTNGHLTKQGEKLMNFFNMKSPKAGIIPLDHTTVNVNRRANCMMDWFESYRI